MTAQTREEIEAEHRREINAATSNYEEAASRAVVTYNRMVRRANAERDRKLAELGVSS